MLSLLSFSIRPFFDTIKHELFAFFEHSASKILTIKSDQKVLNFRSASLKLIRRPVLLLFD